MDANEFTRNRFAHTAEELEPYEEQYVAWSEDGKQVLAHAREMSELYRAIDRKGLTRYVIGFVPSGDFSDLGGGTM